MPRTGTLNDAYNHAFMAAADVLFMSHERLPVSPEEWSHRLAERFSPRVVVIGMGAAGAWLTIPGEGLAERVPAIASRPVVSTVGAGDALFASFMHFYAQSRDPRAALERAMAFAGYMIGEHGGSEGFVDARTVERLLSERTTR